MSWSKPSLKSEQLCYHNCLLHNSDQQLELLLLGRNGEATHIHVNMSSTSLSDPPTVRLCLLSNSYTSEHSHACTEVRPQRNSAYSQSQCDRCFVPVLVCVEQSDTELWVSLLWIWRVGLIGYNYKRDQFPPAKCSAPPVSGNGGLDGLWDWQVDQSSAVMWSFYPSDLVKKELSQKAKLFIYQSIYVPTLPTGRKVWVMT